MKKSKKKKVQLINIITYGLNHKSTVKGALKVKR